MAASNHPNSLQACMRAIGAAAPVGEVFVNGVFVGTPGDTAPTTVVVVGQTATAGVPVAVADGETVRPWYDTLGRQVIAGYDVSSGSLLVTNVAPVPRATLVTAQAALTAAGVGAAVNVAGYASITWQIVIASINTSVTVRVEGSNDGTSFFNMNDAGIDTTYVADDAYELRASCRGILQTRLRFVSEVGGAAVTVTGTCRAAN